jgi:hypothetical protein
VRVVDTPEGGRELRLHMPGYYVRFTLDRTVSVIRVWAVVRLPQV